MFSEHVSLSESPRASQRAVYANDLPKVKLQNLEEVPPWFETELNGYQFRFAASRPGGA
jgi:hypothetical protein